MVTRTTLNVSLTPDLSRFVESRLRSGKYQSASELVREALRLLEAHDRTLPASIRGMKHEIEVGPAQLRRGEGVGGEEFFRRLFARRRTGRARRA